MGRKPFLKLIRSFSLIHCGKRGKYEIVAVFKTTVGDESGFSFYEFVDAENQQEFDEYMTKCKELALYETGVPAEYGG